MMSFLALNLQVAEAAVAAQEDEQLSRLVPRAAPAAARLASVHAHGRRAQLLDPEAIRRRSIQQAVFARAISNHRYRRRERLRIPLQRRYSAFPHKTTVDQMFSDEAFALWDNTRPSAYSTAATILQSSILRSFRMRAIKLELLDRLFPRGTTVSLPNQRQRFVELFPALAQALVQTPA